MKLYNRELEEIENTEQYASVENIIKKQIEFLVQTYGIDEKLLQDRAEGLAVIERSSGDKTYFVEYKGEKQELPNSLTAAAFVTTKRQDYDGEKWKFENGIYMSDSNREHTVIHELFHFLSKIQEMSFDENDVGYSKSGTLIEGYDRDDNIVDISLQARGLNEGITELLTTKVDVGTKPDAYFFQSYIADILISNKHKALLQAYFSSDKQDFERFIEEFESRQHSVSATKLIGMTADGQIIADSELLKGCLEYSLSFCKDMDELKAERKRLLPIFKNMSENLNIEFDDEQLDLKRFFNDILLNKREEIESLEKSDGKIILDSAIEATEEITRTSVINDQSQNIKALYRDKTISSEKQYTGEAK